MNTNDSQLMSLDEIDAKTKRRYAMNIYDTFQKISFCIEVSADFVMFTNKKDERISFDIPTAGAIRGFLEHIFWKPGIQYILTKVEVINPIRKINIKKNEIKVKASTNLMPINAVEKRIQRNNVYLKDVRYRIYADIVFIPEEYRITEYHDGENIKKYYEMLKRRVINGQHRYSPYLGTKECVCNDIEWIDENSEKAEPIHESKDFGMMYVDYLYNENYTKEERMIVNNIMRMENDSKSLLEKKDDESSDSKKKSKSKKPSDAVINARPVFAHIVMNDGVVEYPSKFSLKEEMIEKMKNFWACHA